MKTLLRLALLTLCGAAGILIAVQVAASRSTDAEAGANAPVIAALPKPNAETATESTAVEIVSSAVQSPTTTKVEFKPLAKSRIPRGAYPLSDSQYSAADNNADIAASLKADVPRPRVTQQAATPADSMSSVMTLIQNLSPEQVEALKRTTRSELDQLSGNGGPSLGGQADPQMLLLMKDLLETSGDGATPDAQQLQGLLGVLGTLQQKQEGRVQQLNDGLSGAGVQASDLPNTFQTPGANAAVAVQAPPASAVAPLPPPVPAAEMVPPAPKVVPGDNGLITVHSRDDDVRNLLEQLAEQAGLNVLAAESVQGTVTVNLQDVTIEEAFSAVLKATGFVSRRDGNVMYIGTSADFAALEKSLDRVGTRVLRPNYLNAKELSMLLTPLLTPGVGKISVTSPPAVGISIDNTAAGGDAIAQQDAVVVQDYESILSQIDQVYRELDRRPAQVSIEAVIVSVTLNDANSFGVDFQVLRDKQNVRFGWGSPRQAPLAGGGQVDPATGAPIGQFAFDTGGMKFAFLDDSLGVFLSALETVGDANVIASPKLLCLNKQKAEILIGQRLGYISTTVTQNFSTQNVEFLDVGAQLRLRPFISSDGLIRMEVHPELSEGEVVVTEGFTLPRKTLTEVTTNVMCPNGCTVIIGGLMRENLRSQTTQVPLLGSLPLAGPLFRSKNEQIERTEILVLLTPRIVDDAEMADEGAQGKKDAHDMEGAKFHRMTPVSKAHLSRDYLIRAQSALARGERSHAERYARLAVHYDPLNREAVRFYMNLGGHVRHSGRDGIGGNGGVVSHGWGVETLVGDAPEPATVDGEQVPAWMLDDLGENAPLPEVPQFPSDPGIPGRDIEIVRPEIFRND